MRGSQRVMSMRTRAALALGLGLVGCAPVQRVTLIKTTVPLNDGRFVGPVEVKVPRHADHARHDFEVLVKVVAACDPLFTLAFPDGEQQPLGVKDTRWQELLRARAGVRAELSSQVGPPPPPSRSQPQQQPTPAPTPAPANDANEWAGPPMPAPQPTPTNAEASASVDAQLVIPAPTVGHWERTVSETWAGQLEFEAERLERCGSARTYTAKYLNAFDDTNTVAIWAEVPQELAGASLTVEVIELIPPEKPVAKAIEVEAKAVVKVTPKPRPPQPPPKKENPRPARDAGARWQDGYWSWSERGGEWVWVPGSWGRPATTPALINEHPGAPPIAGCRWQQGHWVWVQANADWNWVPGHWLAPPPLDEPRVDQPDPTSPWNEGHWISVGGTFRWSPGSWGRPQPRTEVRPPPPWDGAQWIPGAWLLISGRWTWSVGFFAGTEKPPPPRVEAIPPQPHPDAVWLAGFWRWNVTTRMHVWVDGHWEVPPGEGYVWVEEKLGQDLVIGGHWEVKVRR